MSDVFRKKRDGRGYGSYYVYAGGRTVNLKTDDVETARAKARALMNEPRHNGVPDATGIPEATLPPPSSGTERPSVFKVWAARNGEAVASGIPVGPSANDAPAVPASSAATNAIAKAMAAGIAKFNAIAARAVVKVMDKRKEPPRITDEQVDNLEEAWSLALSEWLAVTQIKPWHLLLLQNMILVVDLWQDGTPIPLTSAETPPATISPSEGAAAAA